MWISHRNSFDGDSPYSYNDLFARVKHHTRCLILLFVQWTICDTLHTHTAMGKNVLQLLLKFAHNQILSQGEVECTTCSCMRFKGNLYGVSQGSVCAKGVTYSPSYVCQDTLLSPETVQLSL